MDPDAAPGIGEIDLLARSVPNDASTGPEFEQAAANRMTTDAEDFSATPAISDGELFIRSSRHLYCIAEADDGP